MFELAGTIVCSSSLFLIFRSFERFKIDLPQAVVFNYFICFIAGSIVFGNTPDLALFNSSGLLPWVLIIGVLLISLFICLGISSQKNGMGITSVAVKMSLALSAIVFLFLYKENLGIFKTIGFSLAVVGVYLLAFERKKGQTEKRKYGILLFLFVGSATLDVLLNIVQEYYIKDYPKSLFTAFGFLSAGIIGLTWLITEWIRKKRSFHIKNVLAGIVLGIPNYFSIYFLVCSYSTSKFSDATVIAIASVGVVALSAFLGIVVFKESTKTQKMIGLAAVIIAICCLTIK